MTLITRRLPYVPAFVRVTPIALVERKPEPSLPSGAAEPWVAWFREHRQALFAGSKLEVPAGLPPVSQSGFSQTSLAENIGQRRDWVMPISDGSRLHVHEFESTRGGSGKMIVHRDATDPALGLTNAVSHFLFESSSGRIVLAVLVLLIGSLLVWGLR